MDATIRQANLDDKPSDPAEIVICIPDPNLAIEQRKGLAPTVELEASLDNGFALIGGLSGAKARLQAISEVHKNPEAAALYGIGSSHFLLHGPPGTGKTSLARAFAYEINAEFYPVNSTDIIDKWVGSSGKGLQAVFEKAKEIDGKVVVFFDEFDTLALKGGSQNAERIDVKKQLNIVIDELTESYPDIVFAAATNLDLDQIESSLLRSGRLETIGAPAPNDTERIDIWSAVLYQGHIDFGAQSQLAFDEEGNELVPRFNPYADDINPIELALKTEGMTGADFKQILDRARMYCFTRYSQYGEQLQVTHQMLLAQIEQFGR
jgi:SpoVK/Ycf46/Vps4 family AAA+-type ATPase